MTSTATNSEVSPTAIGALTVTLTGIETPRGTIMLALDDSAAGYDAGKPVGGTMVSAIGRRRAISGT